MDVEDYFHVQAFAGVVSPQKWNRYESRVVRNTRRILRLLGESQVLGTFFILGWVAERHPRLVREIQRAGHEIGCHSYWHRLIYEMTPDEFRADLRQARDAIENITGEPVRCFRAPSFSITARSLWALDVLIDEGFEYDSSIFPVRHDTYGIPDADRFPCRIDRPHGKLWEFPLSVQPIGRFHLPVAGGGYFRLYPLWISAGLFSRINRVHRQPFMFYIHPWELDPEQPRLRGSFRSRFRHYQNLRTTEPKLRRLLRRFPFAPLSSVLPRESAAGIAGDDPLPACLDL